jgi:hypothetical protein
MTAMRMLMPFLIAAALLAWAAPALADGFPSIDTRCGPPCPDPCGPAVTPYGTPARTCGPCQAPYPYYRPYYHYRPAFRYTPYFYRPAPYRYNCRAVCAPPRYAPGPRRGYFRASGGTRVGFGARRFGHCPQPGCVTAPRCP